MAIRRRVEPKVVRQEVLWVPETRLVPLASDQIPYRVWTLYGEGRDDPKVPPTLPILPTHNHGAFMEDKMHDWNVVHPDRKPHLHYASRVAEHSVWILIEYTEAS